MDPPLQRPVNSCTFESDLYCVGWGVKLYSLTHSLPGQ